MKQFPWLKGPPDQDLAPLLHELLKKIVPFLLGDRQSP
jgi:hypothetical protein